MPVRHLISRSNSTAILTAAARLAPWLIAVALLLPLMFAAPQPPGSYRLGLPRILQR